MPQRLGGGEPLLEPVGVYRHLDGAANARHVRGRSPRNRCRRLGRARTRSRCSRDGHVDVREPPRSPLLDRQRRSRVRRDGRVSTTNRGRWATFAVEEIWNGDVSDTQFVRSGLPPEPDHGRFSGIAGEHTFEPGERYSSARATVPPAKWARDKLRRRRLPVRARRPRRRSCARRPRPGTTRSRPSVPARRGSSTAPSPSRVVGEVSDPKPVGSHPEDTVLGLGRPWQLALGVGAADLPAALLASVWWRGRHRTSAPLP